MTNSYTWKTHAIIPETADTATIVFDNGGAPFHYQPGQFIDLTLVIDGTPVTRSYSLSSCPGLDAMPAITVKRVKDGVMSNYIIDNAQRIPQWQVAGPSGSFTPPADMPAAAHVVLLAGGSGITPLFSIARAIIAGTAGTKVSLLYSSRRQEDIIFRRALAEWAQQHTGRVQVHHALSEHGRRMSKLVAKKLIRQFTDADPAAARYFICGPVRLMQLYREALDALAVPAANIHQEWFAPDPEAAPVALPEAMQEVLLHFYEQSNLLEVPGGQTILSAALADRIPLPYSCKTGACGRCAARLTAGKVTMAHNYALGPADLDAGMILLCQAYPLNSDVTVEIGAIM